MTQPHLSAEEQNRHEITRHRISIGQFLTHRSDGDSLRSLLAVEDISEARTWELIRDVLEENPQNWFRLSENILNRQKVLSEEAFQVWLLRLLNCFLTLAGDKKVQHYRHSDIIAVIEGLDNYGIELTAEQEPKIAYAAYTYDSNNMNDILVEDYYTDPLTKERYTIISVTGLLDAAMNAEWRRLRLAGEGVQNGSIKRTAQLLSALDSSVSMALAEGAL